MPSRPADPRPAARTAHAQSRAPIPTPYGTFEVIAFSERDDDPMPNLALIAKGTNLDDTTLVRLHSECLTGDLFGSYRCDCGEQLERSLELTGKHGGVILYLRQEGRGIGIINKLRAYRLQDAGADTVDANTQLGLPVDGRDYSTAVAIALQLGLKEIELLTNNPQKVAAFDGSGIEVVRRVPLEIARRPQNARYLDTKRDEMGHVLH